MHIQTLYTVGILAAGGALVAATGSVNTVYIAVGIALGVVATILRYTLKGAKKEKKLEKEKEDLLQANLDNLKEMIENVRKRK